MSQATDLVKIFTDGACSGNPGPGGWGAILQWKQQEKILSGKETETTNNRMELTAVISALESLKRPLHIHIYTDSRYVHDGITLWIQQWKKQQWRKKDKKPIRNIDLWKKLDHASQEHTIEWYWVRGHDGHYENERVDKIARNAIAKDK